jgi:hypothetical protein
VIIDSERIRARKALLRTKAIARKLEEEELRLGRSLSGEERSEAVEAVKESRRSLFAEENFSS